MRINFVKKEFARLRMPLAKVEPSNAHKATDVGFAIPQRSIDGSVVWRVARDKFISRNKLSDSMLSVLEI